MRHASRALRTVLTAALLVGPWTSEAFARPPAYRRLYTGPPRPRSEVAFVFSAGGTILDKINGQALNLGDFFHGGNFPAGCELPPGTYDFCLGFRKESAGRVAFSEKCTSQLATLLPGHMYFFFSETSVGMVRQVFLDASQRGDVLGIQESHGHVEVNYQDRQTAAELRRSRAKVDEYFRGEREVTEPAAAIMEAQARLEAERAEVAQVWDSVVPGCVVDLTFEDKKLVVVVDKRKDDALIYYAVGDPGNTYRASLSSIRRIKILASSVDEYTGARTP